MTDTDVVVVGAGPAGLAVAACLKRRGIGVEVLERSAEVASAWRSHYDRLHLHTSRRFSGLPYRPMPDDFPRYPARDQVVEYLEGYARAMEISPSFGVEVVRVDRDDDGWRVETTDGSRSCRAVVVATGVNGRPRMPEWGGEEVFGGPILHSSAYRSASHLAGRDVLVVGFGNSGGEIALDLAEHGRRPIVSVRGAVNVVPRDLFGIPILAIAIPLSRLPPRLADVLIWPILKGFYPSYRRLGLRKARRGPFEQIARDGTVPLLDIGTIREIRAGRIRIVPEVARLDEGRVIFTDGTEQRVDAIVLATGYEPAAPEIRAGGDRFAVDAGDGLYHCGFHVSPTGMIREMGIEATEIADRLAARLAADPSRTLSAREAAEP